jgi:hypothetical protein
VGCREELVNGELTGECGGRRLVKLTIIERPGVELGLAGGRTQ